MFKLALVYPLEYQKFYINPLRLQIIQAMLCAFFRQKEIGISLIDVNDHHIFDTATEQKYDLIIVDTPEGSIRVLPGILTRFTTSAVLLVGDTVVYGEAQKAFEELSTLPFAVYIAAEDIDVLLFVKSYIEKGYIENDTGLIRFHESGKRDLTEEAGGIAEKYELEFPEWMLELYNQKGIQIFMDGLSRGCENNCSFCKLNNLSNPIIKSVKNSCVNVLDTIKHLQKKRSKRIYIQFSDENFFGGGLARLLNIRALCGGLSNIGFHGILGIDTRLDTVINCQEETEIALLREATWRSLSECGLKYCFLGIETFSETQSSRYNKRLDLSQFDEAISMLTGLNIHYTIGLIIWDPLMDKSELIQNLRFIKEKNLLGKTASLLKCLRVQINSQYLSKYHHLICEEVRSSDHFNVDDDSIYYRDKEIRKMLPFVRYTYNLFNQCGYRHSDVACFEALFDKETPDILKNIPTYVAQLEYDVLQFLLETEYEPQNPTIYHQLKAMCQSITDSVLSGLKKVYPIYERSQEMNAIRQYYLMIFSRILQLIQTAPPPNSSY